MDKQMECINKDLFEKSLRNFFKNDNLEIVEFSTKAAVPTGENYTSYLFRSNVTYSTGQGKKDAISVLVKIQPVGTQIDTLGKVMQHFAKEMEMFSKTLPLMQAALRPKEENCFATSCLSVFNEPVMMLVLEDLQPYGFKMAERRCGLDYEHCAMVMKKIAKFHASSVVIVDKDPSLVTNYHSGMFMENPLLQTWMLRGIETFIESCMQWEGMEKYAHKLQKLGKDVVRRGIEAGNRRLGGFNVINHGDMWINNMLFQYDEDNKLADMKLVDFQIVKYSSPALDLHYFFTTSTSDEVREKHLDNLLDVYYGQLILSLAEMDYNLDTVPTRADFRKDYYSRGLYGVMTAAINLPVMKASHRDDATFENFMSEDDDGVGSYRHHCYTNEVFKKSVGITFSYYEAMGTFNV